jgi:hypothetical protein
VNCSVTSISFDIVLHVMSVCSSLNQLKAADMVLSGTACLAKGKRRLYTATTASMGDSLDDVSVTCWG